MNVVFTIAVLAAAGLWALAVYSKLLRLRDRVKEAWRHLEHDQRNESAKTAYNRCVQHYNTALDGFPASVIAMVAGFKPARAYQSSTGSTG